MKKRWIIVLGITVITFLGLGVKFYMDEKKINEEMMNVVFSDEAKRVFENGLKNLDAKALTGKGVINSYEIDKKSIKQNPMGGIDVTLYVNENPELYVFFTLNNTDDKKMIDDGGGNSAKLEMLLEGK
ncbi:DUF1310 family protein [Listeria welshimeri]|uniref:Uncharacterized protein n=1 Tax=Listeria welshimeri serovar 6b (strain ATCC 35897 / DSM 20650 / CCUG 15529 / CIP 8149 / NCTC 11857 / SLCC 5334 / V8) TaxID=386043 RepID=A0AMC9_LISW6|nr:DUF1310 family protein [Listeria welshimeri]MBC1464211.1 DUF1310 domain-containing protein [Listeria welshimeri]MBC1710659.1 DUF1310 domain-containing protein [Listeria welshimeri]MBF2686978.1 DUF1310 domain-containing protein [Listeria welshimeri]CAK22161.1 conserved hypothetical protein [Listeria welshimeri serovar 6b str. SLCC5334]SNV33150.1 Protein of uncharacterised function (DUF1310) [Listeria welshimeri]